MVEPSDASIPSGPAAAAALPTALPAATDAGAAAVGGKRQPLAATWEATPDAAASTCVSGSEGSLPSSNQQQQQQPQQKLQSDVQSPVHCTEAQSDRLTASGSGDTAMPQSEQQPQQQQQQQLHAQHPGGLALHVASVKRSQGNRSDGSVECGAPSAPLTSDAISSVAAQQLQRGSSGSSCCSSTSIGGELRGLINALASVDSAAGSGELQQLLQQLLAERDLYKAAFGAAKEELKVRET